MYVPSLLFVRMASPRSIFSSPLRPEQQQAATSQVTPTKNILFREGLPQPVLFLSEHILCFTLNQRDFKSYLLCLHFLLTTIKIHHKKSRETLCKNYSGGFEPVLGIHDILVLIRICTSDLWIRIRIQLRIRLLSSFIRKSQKHPDPDRFQIRIPNTVLNRL
jgi:hypothetical protein